jgi:hypothetical protein
VVLRKQEPVITRIEPHDSHTLGEIDA